MNRHQFNAATRITNRATELAAMYCEPAMVWSIRQLSDRTVELVGSSVDVSDRRWFDNSRLLQAFIGKRGGVKLSRATDKLYDLCK